MTTRASFAKAMIDDVYDWSYESYALKTAIFKELFMLEKSSGSYEQWTTAIGPTTLTRTAEGETITRRNMTEGFTVHCANFKYADEYPITDESIKDNRKEKSLIKSWSEAVGEAANITQEEQHANVFNYGGFTAGHDDTFLQDIPNVLSTSYGNLVYDSKPFFNLVGNLRTAKNGQTYYNGISSLDLTATNLQTLFQLMAVTNAKNEAGLKVSIIPDTLICQFGSSTWFTALKLINSKSDVDAVQEGIFNVWGDGGNGAAIRLRVVGWSYLTDSDAWFLIQAKKGLKSLAREPLLLDDYEEKKTDSHVIRAKIRFGKAVVNFRHAVGANFATS